MAKKVAVRKTAKSRSAGRKSAPKKQVKKARRRGGAHVSMGVHGMKEILEKIKSAGLEEELNKVLDKDDLFVRVQRKSLNNLRDFIHATPELSELQTITRSCNCPPDDPYCIYLG